MKRLALLPLAALALAAACGDGADGPTILAPDKPFKDDIPNSLDATVDAVAEVMPLVYPGANGTTQLYVVPKNGDGKNGCNLTGSTTLVVLVSSSNTSVATVSPASITFENCDDTKTLTVTPVGLGSATISLSETSNNTGGTFNLGTATFTVNVAPPPNTPPAVSVTGVTGGASYEIGSVPAAVCSVVDAEDGNSSFAATLSAISGLLAAYGVGQQTASCSYTDGGGLTAVASETYNIVDTTAPVITFVSRTPAVNGNGWNNSEVTVNWSCSDNPGSGVVAASVSQTVSTEGANQSATGTCKDRASNEASDTQSGINVDKTAPVVSVTGVSNGATYILGSVPTAGCSTTDALSGVATHATLGTSGGPVGSVTVTCSGAIDNADNAAAPAIVTYSVIYSWTGFLRPVDNLPVLNVVKAGSAVPVKFSLGGDQGLGIMATGYPRSVTIACSSTDPAEDVDQTVTAGSSSLAYDATTDTYTYVWKTDKAWAGQCRQLIVQLADGKSYHANFRLTK